MVGVYEFKGLHETIMNRLDQGLIGAFAIVAAMRRVGS